MKKMTLRELYVKCGSQENLAEYLGIGKNMIQLWLSSKSKPSWESLQTLRKAGVSIDAFPD